ncbi:hypothetical protein D3C72_1750460 [compost metagenome]
MDQVRHRERLAAQDITEIVAVVHPQAHAVRHGGAEHQLAIGSGKEDGVELVRHVDHAFGGASQLGRPGSKHRRQLPGHTAQRRGTALHLFVQLLRHQLNQRVLLLLPQVLEAVVGVVLGVQGAQHDDQRHHTRRGERHPVLQRVLHD